jgi:hypothetical protein
VADVRCWHFSEVVVPKRDVRSWRKTGSSRPTTKMTRLTQLGHLVAAEQRFICEVGDHSPGSAIHRTSRSSGPARPRTPTARRAGPLLHDQPRAVGGHLHANPIFFRTLSNPVSWNVASWPTPCLSNTLIFSCAPSGSDRRSPTASPL